MDYSSLQDKVLLDLMRNKSDEAAFRIIYVRYWRQIYLLAYKKIHDKELAEELTQNIFVSLWERRDNVVILSLKNWLYGALKFSIINHYKSQMVHEKYVQYTLGNFNESSHTSEELIYLKDLSDAIDKGVLLLPKKTQEVFKLSRMENRSVKEISKAMNISEKSVEYHITQSLKVMRLHLKDYIMVFILFIAQYK